MSTIAISLNNVSKKFLIYDSPLQRLKEAIRRGKRRYHREFWALRDINLEIPEGVTLGILGQNGSGKTTILQLLAGIMNPSSGDIKVRGRVSTILELGAGFNPDFTGRENAFLSGIILGLRPAEIKEKMFEIIEFSEIGEFIDQPVKTYSSGMYVRLAFAVAVTLDPDILLIDEVLAVGDAYFQHKCTRKIREFQEQGKTMVYVTHDIESVSNICHQAIILDYSKILAQGKPGDITSQYLALIDGREQEHAIMQAKDNRLDQINTISSTEPKSYSRYGSKEAEITRIEILDEDGSLRTHFMTGEEFTIRFHVYFQKDVDRFVLGNIFRNKWGLNVFGTNTQWFGLSDKHFRKGDRCIVIFHHRAEFANGTYSINPAASLATGEDAYRTLDWINNAAIIHIRNSRRMDGYVNLPTEIEIEMGNRE
jgi:ABC-type polysaccharide/polyol phosphate transport system ATPase subunit